VTFSAVPSPRSLVNSHDSCGCQDGSSCEVPGDVRDSVTDGAQPVAGRRTNWADATDPELQFKPRCKSSINIK
jgi:hypothetical protein